MKLIQFISIVLFAFFSMSCIGAKPSVTKSPLPVIELSTGNKLRKKLVKTALKYKGTKYKGGGTTKKGMDCSGLIYTVFKENGMDLPRRSIDQGRRGKDIKLKKVQIGDLLFFNNNPKRNVINHVGMVVEIKNDVVLFIHTSSKKGVMVSSLKEPYHMRTFVKAKDLID